MINTTMITILKGNIDNKLLQELKFSMTYVKKNRLTKVLQSPSFYPTHFKKLLDLNH